ncbi:energy transducer TonB [Erythrobacter sp. HA6-11]
MRAVSSLIGIVTIATLAMFLTPQSLAKEGEAESFEAAGPWVFDYAADHCAFRRVFKSNKESFWIEFRQYQPGISYDLIVMSEKRRSRDKGFEYRFAPDERVRKRKSPYQMNSDDGGQGYFVSGSFGAIYPDELKGVRKTPAMIDQARTEWAKVVEALEILRGFGEPVRLETGAMADLMEVRQHCLNRLMESWGVDPERYASQSRRAMARDFSEWSGHVRRSYPIRAALRGVVGATRLRLAIDETGAVTDCVGLGAIADKQLYDASCRAIMEHGRYEPALDADGQPFASFHIMNVSYRM